MHIFYDMRHDGTGVVRCGNLFPIHLFIDNKKRLSQKGFQIINVVLNRDIAYITRCLFHKANVL